MILVDTSGFLAALDAGERHHAAAVAALRGAPGPLILSPFVLAELDYLIRRRVSAAAADALLRQVSAGALRLEAMGPGDVGAATRIMDRYADHDIGLTDASIVVLALRYSVHDVLTLDERHFRAMLGPADRPFRVLPADAA